MGGSKPFQTALLVRWSAVLLSCSLNPKWWTRDRRPIIWNFHRGFMEKDSRYLNLLLQHVWWAWWLMRRKVPSQNTRQNLPYGFPFPDTQHVTVKKKNNVNSFVFLSAVTWIFCNIIMYVLFLICFNPTSCIIPIPFNTFCLFTLWG